MNQEYQLECPACLVRFHLKKHLPGKRIRCRKCRRIMTIPPLPGVVIQKENRSLTPERKAVITRPLRLRILGLLVPLLLLALGTTTFLLLQNVEVRPDISRDVEKEDPMTFSKLKKENSKSPLPLAIGLKWKYRGAGDVSEERRVISSHLSMDGEPQFEYTASDPVDSSRMILRATNEGTLLISEKTIKGVQIEYDPPLMIVPRPFYIESVWSYNGTVTKGNSDEKWDLVFSVEGVESLITPVGTFSCMRVRISGYQGDIPLEKTVWYSPGTGPVQIRKNIGERKTTFTLSELNGPKR